MSNGYERVITVDHRAPDDQATKARHGEEVDQCLIGSGKTFAIEADSQLSTRKGTFGLKRVDDCPNTSINERPAYAFLAQTALDSPEDPRGRYWMQPPVIETAHEMKRPSVQPRNQQAFLVQ